MRAPPEGMLGLFVGVEGGGCAWFGWPTGVPYRQESMVGRLGPDLRFVPSHGTSALRGGPSVGGSWLFAEKVVLMSGIRPHLW